MRRGERVVRRRRARRSPGPARTAGSPRPSRRRAPSTGVDAGPPRERRAHGVQRGRRHARPRPATASSRSPSAAAERAERVRADRLDALPFPARRRCACAQMSPPAPASLAAAASASISFRRQRRAARRHGCRAPGRPPPMRLVRRTARRPAPRAASGRGSRSRSAGRACRCRSAPSRRRRRSRGNGPRDRRAPPRPRASTSTCSTTACTSSCADERRLDVDLGELRLPVGAQVLVAEAARDLEVAVEARHHQQLLVDLRRLRQRVELARVHAARHEIVARALGRRLGEDRRLDLEEAEVGRGAPRAAAAAGGAGSGCACSSGRRRSSTRCLSRSSSAASSSPSFRATGMAGVSAGPTTRARVTCTSTSREASVGVARRLGPQRHRRPRPARPSRRRAAAARAITSGGVHRGSKESCTRPARSRRSRKTSPPRSRRRCTQPPRRTLRPTCSRLSSPQTVRAMEGSRHAGKHTRRSMRGQVIQNNRA